MTYPIPISTLMITLTAVGFGLVSNLLTRRFVDLNAERRIKAEVNAYNAELKAAMRAGDKEKEQRLRKKDKQMAQMRLKMQSGRMKLTLGTSLPFLAIYWGLASLMGGFNVVVAHSPIPIPYIVSGQGDVALFWWYTMSSFTFSGILTRLLGTAA